MKTNNPNFKKIFSLAILPLLLVGENSSAGRGGYSGGGGDTTVNPTTYLSWYSNRDEVVKVCAEFGPKFSRLSETLDDLRFAFSTWTDYLKSKNINSYLINPRETRASKRAAERDAYYNDGNGTLPLPSSSSTKPGFPSAFEVRNKCVGDESVVVYFGVENEQVREERKKFISPLAFTARTKFAEEAGVIGFIWVSDDPTIHKDADGASLPITWNNRNSLRTILVHEIGHTLGISHVPETIMTEDILLHISLQSVKSSSGTEGVSIDQNRSLFMTDQDSYSHLIMSYPTGTGKFDVETPFVGINALLGFFGADEHPMNMNIRLNSVNAKEAVIEIKSAKFERSIRFEVQSSDRISGESVFAMKSFPSLSSDGKILYGSIKNEKGLSMPAILSVNLPDHENRRAKLVVVKDGRFLEVGTFKFAGN